MKRVFRHILALAAVFGLAAGVNAGDLRHEIEDVRAGTSDYVFMHGGIFDGAAMGQTTTFVVTPDDRLQCVMVFNPTYAIGTDEEELFTPEMEVKIRSYDQVIPELYVRLQLELGVLESSGPSPAELGDANFIVEMSQAGGKTWAKASWGDPRFHWISDELFAYPQSTDCWLWG